MYVCVWGGGGGDSASSLSDNLLPHCVNGQTWKKLAFPDSPYFHFHIHNHRSVSFQKQMHNIFLDFGQSISILVKRKAAMVDHNSEGSSDTVICPVGWKSDLDFSRLVWRGQLCLWNGITKAVVTHSRLQRSGNRCYSPIKKKKKKKKKNRFGHSVSQSFVNDRTYMYSF